MTLRVVLGVDVSTAALRVTALDVDAATEVASASAALSGVSGEPGIREQDADYAALALTAIDRALGRVAEPFEVASIAITTTSGTVVPVDAEGLQRGVAVMYDDGRGTSWESRLSRKTGRPTSMLGRMMALAARDPEFRAASVAQVIGSALIGEPAAGDTSHFLKAGIDPSKTEWEDVMLADADLRRHAVPVLVQPGTVLGTVRSGGAAGALLIAGMTDGCTSQIASGAVSDGQSVGVLGTTLVLKAVSPVDNWDAATGIYAHRSPDGRFWLGGASNVGGGSVVGPPGLSYAEAETLARANGPSTVVRYPLARTGERFPVANSRLMPFVVDLTGAPVADLDPIAAYRAGLEGVALVERLGLEALGIVPSAGQRILSGGGTRNGLWNEIRAATLGAVVRIPAHAESGFGAAILAAWGMSTERFADVVARFSGGGVLLEPDPELTAVMAERYSIFRAALARQSNRSSS
jgi:sugar (pentulose or hexulose) kinase